MIRVVGGYYTNMTRAVEVGLEMWKAVGLNVKLKVIENWGKKATPMRLLTTCG